MSVDYLLDLFDTYKEAPPKVNIRPTLWKTTKLFLTKLFFYTLLVLLSNALQVHLFKDTCDALKWIISIPIISESFGVISAIEKYTGLKLSTTVAKFFKDIFSKSGVEAIVDDLKDK